MNWGSLSKQIQDYSFCLTVSVYMYIYRTTMQWSPWEWTFWSCWLLILTLLCFLVCKRVDYNPSSIGNCCLRIVCTVLMILSFNLSPLLMVSLSIVRPNGTGRAGWVMTRPKFLPSLPLSCWIYCCCLSVGPFALAAVPLRSHIVAVI